MTATFCRRAVAIVSSDLNTADHNVPTLYNEAMMVQGTVADVSQGAIPNAKVTVRNEATGVVRETVTNAEGIYRVSSLGPGTYTITVEKSGFGTKEQKSVELGLSEIGRVDGVVEQEVPAGPKKRGPVANIRPHARFAMIAVDEQKIDDRGRWLGCA